MTKIELEKLTKREVRSLSGQDRGLHARIFFKLDELDELNEPIVVSAPDDLAAITPSFVQGMFGKSVLRLGQVSFFKHYIFEFSTDLMKDVESGVERILFKRRPQDLV
jgi:hypothetical protein